MSHDSDPPEEPTPSDGPEDDGTGSADAADGDTEREEGTADGSPPEERPDADEADVESAGADGEDTEASDADDGNDADDADDAVESDDDPAADDADGPDERTSPPGVDESIGDAGRPSDRLEEREGPPSQSPPDSAVEERQRLPEGSAGPPGGSTDARAETETTATGDGGVQSAAMSAAEKGMDTLNEGFDAVGGGSGPDSDEEMPLTDHIEEMMRRLSVVFAVGLVVSLGVLFVGSVSPTVPSAAEIVRFFWDAHIGYQEYTPHVYGPLEFLLTKLKVAGLAGLFVGLPVFVYETYLFMRPGLYPNERRYYLAAIPTSFVLGIVGGVFAHVAVLPFLFDYFIRYSQENAILAFGLSDTFNLILLMMGYFAIVFQIPLFMQLAVMMNVVSRRWMEQRRLLFWGAFLGLAFTFIAADPTGFASIIVAVTMIVLFEATLVLLRWTGN